MVQTYPSRPLQRWKCCCTVGSWLRFCFFLHSLLFLNCSTRLNGSHTLSLLSISVLFFCVFGRFTLGSTKYFCSITHSHSLGWVVMGPSALDSLLYFISSHCFFTFDCFCACTVPVNSFSFVKSQSLCAMNFTRFEFCRLRADPEYLHDGTRSGLEDPPRGPTSQRSF